MARQRAGFSSGYLFSNTLEFMWKRFPLLSRAVMLYSMVEEIGVSRTSCVTTSHHYTLKIIAETTKSRNSFHHYVNFLIKNPRTWWSDTPLVTYTYKPYNSLKRTQCLTNRKKNNNKVAFLHNAISPANSPSAPHSPLLLSLQLEAYFLRHD